MTEPKYDEDSVTLGYLKKILNNEIVSEKSTSISKVYSTQPKPSYSKGDIWIDGNNVYVCVNSRKVGYFSLSDWSTESGAKQKAEYKTRTYLTIPSNYRMGDLWILQSDNDHKSGKKGEILVANKNAESYNADDWVKEISYVTQEERQEINEELQTATNNIAKLETTAGLIEARVVQTEVKLDNTYSKEEVEALNEEITEELEIVKKDTGDLRVQSNSISAKVESVEANLTQVTNTAITQVKVLYALSNSATEAPTSGWSETAPEWQKGKYMWQKTATTNGVSTTYSEATCIQGAKGQDGENGKDGVNGKDGANGSDGKSAYQIWLDAGNTGTEEDYLVSLKGEQGIQGLQGLQGEKGEQGIPGPKGDTGATGAKGDKGDTGTSGATSYFHIKYSPVANPTALQMTETPNTYIGTYVDFTQEDSTSPDNYTWYKVIGDDGKDGVQGPQGEQGIPGTNGSNGQTSYFHIKYSNDGGKSFTDNNGETVGTYIGTYVDFTKADSTNVLDYTWAEIKGQKGDKGDTGSKGSDGVGINSTTVSYGISDNSTTKPTSWQTTIPTVAEGKYLWTRTITDYTDSSIQDTVTYTYAKQGTTGAKGEKGDTGATGATGAKGDKGDTGDSGSSVTVSSIKYQAGTSATTAPNEAWSDSVVSVAEGQYLWTKTTFSDGTVAYGVAKQGEAGAKGDKGDQGDKGDTGIGVQEIVAQYYLSDSNTAQAGGSWKETQDEWQNGKYMWTRSKITWTDNTITYTTPILATDVNETNEKIEKLGNPTASFQGKSGTIESAEANLDVLEIRGESTQETRSGINQLMPFGEGETSYFSTLTQLEDSDTFYYKATPLADNWLKVECDRTEETVTAERYINFSILSDKLPNLKTSTKYTIIVEFRNINITQSEGYLYFGNTSDKDKDDFFNSYVAINLNSIQNNLVKKLLITNDSFEGQRAPLRDFQTVCSQDKFSYEMRLSIVEGDYTNKDYVYEDFGTMPSPDYLSEIKSVESPAVVKSTGKNLLKNTANTFESGGRTFVLGDGAYKATGTSTNEVTTNIITGTASGRWVSEATLTAENSIFVKSGEYMFSCDRVSSTQRQIYFLIGDIGDTWSSGSKSYIAGNATKKKIIIENDCYITFMIYDYSPSGSEIEITNMQLEKGTETTEYESYQENIGTIPLLHEMRSLPNGVYDRIYKQNGAWYDEQNIGQIVLDGSENYGYNATYTAFYSTMLADVTKKPENNNEISVIANYFQGETANNCINSEYNYCLGFNTLGSLWIRYNELTTVDDFKTWLATHNTEIIYELSEPIITEISDEATISALESIKTYKGITNITADTFIEANYYTNNNLNAEYVNKVENDINQRYVNEKIAKIELTNEQIEQTVASNKIASDNDKQELLQKFDNYAPSSEITRVENKVTQLQTDTYTKTQIDTKLVDGSVTKLKSTTLLADDDGLTVDKSDSKTKSNLDADGLTILDKTGSTNDTLLRAQYDEEKGETVVETKNLYVQKYLTVAETGRLENYTRADGKVGVGGFYVGG